MKKIALLLISIAVAGALIVSSCSSNVTTGSNGLSGTITEAGSTTVQPLAERMADAFHEIHPNVTVTIQGGGSSVGVKSAADGTVDIGGVSRELKPGEPELIKHLLCLDGIAIITDNGDTVNGLNVVEIRDIFAGEITNWSEVGGSDEEIIVVAREEGSGTRTAFEEMVMDDELVANSAILQPSNGAIRTTISITPYFIGFVSFGYQDESVKSLAVDGVKGSVENAKDGSYPIVRPLYFLTDDKPEGIVEDFISFCLGPSGQAIVEDEGYISVN